MTDFYMIKNSDIKTVTSGTAQVSGNDSYQTGYEFSNVYTYYDKPWLEWKASYNNKNTHTITLNFSGSSSIFCIFNANFSYINYLSEDRALGYNYISKDYRGKFVRGGTDSQVFTIPAQATIDGEYFKIGSIVIASGSASLGPLFYPEEIRIVRPQSNITTVVNNNSIASDGRMLHELKFKKRNMTYSALTDFNLNKIDVHCIKPFVFFEELTEQEKIYLVKRLPDYQYNDAGYRNWESDFSVREIW